MLKLQVCIIGAIAFLLVVLSGCAEESSEGAQNADDEISIQSVTVIFTDDEKAALDATENESFFEFLGKTYVDELAREHFKSARENRDVLNDPEWDEESGIKLTVNHFIVSQSMCDTGFIVENLKCNMNSMIENGYYAIIPRNPYTGEDIKTSLEYSPGDFLIATNEKASVCIQHLGLMDSNCYLDLEGYDNLYYVQVHVGDEGYVTDGRTEYMYGIYDEDMMADAIKEITEMRINIYGDRYTHENAKLYWLNRQMFEILSSYSQEFEDVLPTLEDYLNYFGRKNPAAWINPYTGKPMEQREQFAVCKNIPGDVTDLLDRPVLYFKVSEPAYVNHYAGNYSFAVVEGKKGPKAVFVIYFLNRENKLEALSCYADPNSNHNRAVHESR
jgi:hypothetical protein